MIAPIEQPWWWQHAAPSAEGAEALPDRTDVLVVGSGYAGLCCAVELARAGTDVTVVDAGLIGSGASTRAAGFLSGRAGVSKQIDLVAAVGAEQAVAILCEADEAYEHLQTVIASEQIDCDFQPCGRFMGANSPAAYARLERKMADYDIDGRAGFQMVPKQDQDTYVRSGRYFGGMLVRNAGTLHPAKYHAGLVRCCRDAGVRFLPNTRVEGVARESGEFRVATARGQIRAGRVALGTNGYTDRSVPWHRRRIIPVSSSLIATEPLGRDLVDRLFPAGCPVIDTRRVLNLARPTPDREAILFGGRASFLNISDATRARILHRQLGEMFPEVADVAITHVWGGQMGFTFDFLPKVGSHDGIDFALGCNGGSGIVMMSWLGRKMARNILGTANRESAFQQLPFKSHAFYSGNPWLLPVVGNYYKFRDWLDLKFARPG